MDLSNLNTCIDTCENAKTGKGESANERSMSLQISANKRLRE